MKTQSILPTSGRTQLEMAQNSLLLSEKLNSRIQSAMHWIVILTVVMFLMISIYYFGSNGFGICQTEHAKFVEDTAKSIPYLFESGN